MVDLDIRDMFLNFMLHEDSQQYVGIDIMFLFNDKLSFLEKLTLWERWLHCAMGLKSSLYQTIRAMLFAEEFLKGFPKNLCNSFHFALVRLNLPGTASYSPSLP